MSWILKNGKIVDDTKTTLTEDITVFPNRDNVPHLLFWESTSDGLNKINPFAVCPEIFEDSAPACLWVMRNGSISKVFQSATVGAFSNCATLNSVSLPSTLKAVGAEAFTNTALRSVTIPQGCAISSTSFPTGCVITRK